MSQHLPLAVPRFYPVKLHIISSHFLQKDEEISVYLPRVLSSSFFFSVLRTILQDWVSVEKCAGFLVAKKAQIMWHQNCGVGHQGCLDALDFV